MSQAGPHTHLTGTQLIFVGAKARRRLGRARLKHLPAHAKAGNEGRPYQKQLQHVQTSVRLKVGLRPGKT